MQIAGRKGFGVGYFWSFELSVKGFNSRNEVEIFTKSFKRWLTPRHLKKHFPNPYYAYILKSFNYPNSNFVLFPFIRVKFVNHSGAMLNKFALLKEKITSFKIRKPKWFEYISPMISEEDFAETRSLIDQFKITKLLIKDGELKLFIPHKMDQRNFKDAFLKFLKIW